MGRRRKTENMVKGRKGLLEWFRADKFRIVYLVELVVFVIFAIMMGMHHEPWADETQAWLIARDSSVAELFTTVLHFDGHPALWHLVLKFFQAFGLPFENLFIIPIIFSTIGVAIFLFKSKFPWYLKIMFPFTFVVFYQFTIVARGYCLLLPLLGWLACIWDKRYEKIWQFLAVMILLISAEVFSLLFAAGVYLDYIYGVIRRRKKMGKKEKWKFGVVLLTLALCFIGTAIYAFPSQYYVFSNVMDGFGWYFLADSFMTPFYCDVNWKIVASVVIFGWILVGYWRSERPRNILQFLIFTAPLIMFMMMKYFNLWHLLIVTLVAIFCFWIHKMERNKWIIVLLGVTFLVQIYWTVWAAVYDYAETYDPAKQVAEFLENYQDKEIYGQSFGQNAVNAYYEENIFENWDDKGYFNWDSRGEVFREPIDEEAMLENDYDVVVTSMQYWQAADEKLEEKYEIYEFPGMTFFEDREYEDTTMKIYVRKGEK